MTANCQYLKRLRCCTCRVSDPFEGGLGVQMNEAVTESHWAADAPSPRDPAGGRLRHRRLWMAIAAAVVMAGVAGTVYAFSGVRDSAANSHKQLAASSVQIAATLQLAIQHEQDLILSTQSFIVADPNPSEAQFASWASDLNVLHRYHELIGIVVIRYVPASQLATYVQGVWAGQATPFTVLPAGGQPFYCFAPIGIERSTSLSIPANYNLCSGSLGEKILAARSSGHSAVLPLTHRTGRTVTRF